MINGSFVFGMDGDDASVFERTVEWAIEQGIETATFHILTPYPGTALYSAHGGPGPHHRPRLGSVRHAPRRVPAGADVGRAARSGILARLPRLLPLGDRSRAAPPRTATLLAGLRHFAYAAGWKKFEPLWDLVIRAKRAGMMLPVLETILSEFGRRSVDQSPAEPLMVQAPPNLFGTLFGAPVVALSAGDAARR